MVVISYTSPVKQVKYVYWWWLSITVHQTTRSSLYTDGGYQVRFSRQAGQVCILMVVISYFSLYNQVRFVHWWRLWAIIHQTNTSIYILMVDNRFSSPVKQIKFVYCWWLSATLHQTSRSGLYTDTLYETTGSSLYTDDCYQLLFTSQAGQICILMVVISYCSAGNQVRFVHWWCLSTTVHKSSRSSLYTDGVTSYWFARKLVKFV